ncbi:hypothetical protein NEF87_000558 [Candidatus Lokiarchaeum ossiferum]|uniref:ABC3 transporter permease C-terminal domain-containing protein n=1 Tax=Candidatus Lokiarchaeum ossiferum TaxID=2951803 RepID=A0ABY6HL89_9ARCH|nr:hypothetical protein NEF87_000558 [Candidatus Lokiarchaeum sp. B-35]
MLLFSIKNVFRKKIMAILSSLGIGFGLMLMFVLGAFSSGVEAQLEDNFAEVIGVVEIQEQNPINGRSELPKNTMDILFDAPLGEDIQNYNVKVSLPTAFTLPYIGNIREDMDGDVLQLTGINQTLDQLWKGPTSKITLGRDFIAGEKEIILDSRLIDVDKLDVRLGDFLTVYLEISPLKNVTELFEIVGFYSQDDSGAPDFVPRSYYGYMDLEIAWSMLGKAGLNNETFTSIDLLFPSTSNEQTTAYIDQIIDLSDSGEFGDIFVQAFSLGQFQESLSESFDIFNSFFLIISLITALAGGMAIIVSQLSSVNERRKEFAILKSTGWKNRHIFTNIIIESLVLGILGAVIGIGLGLGIIQLLGSLEGAFSSATAKISQGLVIQVLSFALGIGVIGGMYPGIKAARLRPVEVLKGE